MPERTLSNEGLIAPWGTEFRRVNHVPIITVGRVAIDRIVKTNIVEIFFAVVTQVEVGFNWW